jgi:outer membrane protein assembly factor BamB
MTTLAASKPPPSSATEVKREALRFWRQLAAVAASLLLLVGVILVFAHWRDRTNDPLRSPQLLALKEKLLSSPKDESIKQQIRALDLQLRQRYFRQLGFNQGGAYLLLSAATFFLLAANGARRVRPSLPHPTGTAPTVEHHMTQARWSRYAVSGAGILFALGLAGFALEATTPIPATVVELEKMLAHSGTAAPASDAASPQEIHQNWPRFRGPDGDGRVSTNSATPWDCRSGFAVRWKTDLPLPGFNSPIVWLDRIFLTGATKDTQEVFCFSHETGELLWRRPVPKSAGSARPGPEVPEQTGFAASSMATDGRRVYAIFATGDLGAFTMEGKLVWSKNLTISKNPHGHASSLVTWEGRLIVQVDQGDPEQSLSKLYAIDGASGRVVWQRSRAVPSSWATPLAIRASGSVQIVALGVPWVMAYSVQDGAELWRVEGLNNEVTPSPVFAGGMLLAVSPNEKLLAIRPDGRGEVTKTHLAWTAEDNIPDISSPVSDGDLVFTLSTPGMLTCYDLKDGKKQWEQDLAMECNASPSIVGDQLCLISAKGMIVVAQPSRTYKELGRKPLDEPVNASPAFAGADMIIRGNTHLYCLGDKPRLAQSR